MQYRWGLENRTKGLWRTKIHADWYIAVVHSEGTLRSPDRLPRAGATSSADRSCREQSDVPPSSRSHRVQEIPLRLHADPDVIRVAEWRDRDVPQLCCGRCCPATD